MIHDVAITLALVGYGSILFGWQMDSMYLTALLTVIGFSVQDKIVVFDRVRENSNIYRKLPFLTLVNHSIVQTLQRFKLTPNWWPSNLCFLLWQCSVASPFGNSPWFYWSASLVVLILRYSLLHRYWSHGRPKSGKPGFVARVTDLVPSSVIINL